MTFIKEEVGGTQARRTDRDCLRVHRCCCVTYLDRHITPGQSAGVVGRHNFHSWSKNQDRGLAFHVEVNITS